VVALARHLVPHRARRERRRGAALRREQLVVISKTGKVVAVREGMTDGSELEDLVKQVL
jgi:hypothetical protein